MIGYTGPRRSGAMSEPVRPRLLPILNCSRCGQPGRVQPALTTTKDGITTVAYPVTCRTCIDTYQLRGKERTRSLVTYVPLENLEKEEFMPTITSDDRKMLDRVLQLKADKHLTWNQVAELVGRKLAAVTNAVQQPESYLYQGIKDDLYKFVERHGEAAEAIASPLPVESPEPERVESPSAEAPSTLPSQDEPSRPTWQALAESLVVAQDECRDLRQECKGYLELASTFLTSIAETAIQDLIPSLPGFTFKTRVSVIVDLVQMEVPDAI